MHKVHALVRILFAKPVIKYLILHWLLSFLGAYFRAYFRGLAVPRSKAICGRDGLPRDFGRRRHENLFGAISWLTFLRVEQRLSAAIVVRLGSQLR
jgi:hypothetical protein